MGAVPTAEALTRAAQTLPDSPGVYLFRDAQRQGPLRRQGELDPQARGRPLLQAGGARGSADMVAQIAEVEFIATETEAEALLAEQNFIRSTGRVFNVRLRDDKSYPYIAISLDEDFPRVYFTRERHRRGRAYFGPFTTPSACARRSTCSARSSSTARATAPSPAAPPAAPASTTTSSAARRPASATSRRRSTAQNIDAIIAFLSGRYRQIERGARAADAAGGARSRSSSRRRSLRNRLKAVRSLLERQRISNEAVGTLDAIAVAAEGTDANAQVFQVRDGVLADRQSFYLENEAGRDEAEVAEEFVLQYYASALAIPPQVIVPRAVEDTRGARRRRSPSAAAPRSSCATPSAATSGGSSSSPSATRGLRSTRTGCARSAAAASAIEALDGLQQALGMDTLPMRIECFDISNLMARRTRSRRWSCSRAARRRSPTTAASGSAGSAQDDFAAMAEVLSRRMAQFVQQRERSPHEPRVRRELRRGAGADRDRRRQGPALGGPVARSGRSATSA